MRPLLMTIFAVAAAALRMPPRAAPRPPARKQNFPAAFGLGAASGAALAMYAPNAFALAASLPGGVDAMLASPGEVLVASMAAVTIGAAAIQQRALANVDHARANGFNASAAVVDVAKETTTSGLVVAKAPGLVVAKEPDGRSSVRPLLPSGRWVNATVLPTNVTATVPAETQAQASEAASATGGTNGVDAPAVTLEVTLGEPGIEGDDVAELVWVRTEGVEREMRVYALLRAGETYTQPSFAGDAWLVCDTPRLEPVPAAATGLCTPVI